MHNLEYKNFRSGGNGRFLKLALLSILILSAITLPSSAAPAEVPNQLPAAQEQLGPAWIFQGPAPQLGGPAQDLANIAEPDEPVSGAVAAIAASPTDPDLVYIGAANGGVWKTTNATDPYPTWTPLTDQLQSQSIGMDALALDPLDTTDQTVLVGTGRDSAYARRGDDLVGLYYTTDGGTTWTITTDSQLSAARITGVAARGNTLLAASENGLYRSTTGPLGTWTEISGTGILPDARAASIEADPHDTNVLYVTFIGASGGLFRTDDLGATWTNITGNIDVISSDTDTFDVAVYNDGSTNVVTALLNGTQVTNAQVSSATEISTTVTITTTAAHGFEVGQSVTTAGVSVTGYNGTYTIASVPTDSTFTYQAAAGLANATGGTATTSEMANVAFRSVNGGAYTTLDVPFVFKDAHGKFGIVADKTNPDLVYISGGYTLVGSDPFLASTYRLDASQPSDSQLTHLYSPVSSETIGGDMTATQTYAWVRRGKVDFPPATPFDITIDSEQLRVTNVAEHSWYYTFTVVRGVNGTTAAAHTIYTPVPAPKAYGAPHVDINNLAVDANGSLLMGAHGGISNLPNPADPSSTANLWLSKNGNLGVSEMHDVAYDHVTGTLIGANQDNAVVYQSAPGNLTWSVGPGYSGDGGDVAVADIGDGQSVRYGANQSLNGFQRQVYDDANNLVSKTYLSTSVITDKQFTTPIAVNAVDPHRLLIGGSDNLYESLNMGDTINKIATVGVYNRDIAYGGRRNGIDNPDVFYVVDSAHNLHTRTTANGTVVTKSLPSGLWYVRDIVINSEDWMNVFATDQDDVFASTDGGDTWTDITGNLLSISSTEIQTIEFVEGPSPYIVVGTRSGVFASNLGALGNWVELGTDLPDVLVFELDYDAVDDVLAAGTLGRGAWLLPDASKAVAPVGVPPVLALSGATAIDEGSTQTYTFTVNDPGDSFTVDSLTVSAGGELVSDSLVTTATGGSFQVAFPDGPASANVSLQVLDSTGELSNLETIAVTVNNIKPSVAILGAPTSGSPGTTVNLSSSVTDPSSTDTTAGFTYYWLVQKYVDGVFVGNFASGDAADFSYTPDVIGKYNVFFRAQDQDGLWSNWAFKPINAASPDLTTDALTVTVPEGATAANLGTYAHHGPAPLTLNASIGTLTQAQTQPTTSLNVLGYWQLGEGDPSVTPGDYSATVINDAPEAYWRLNETTGSVAADSANGHDGTYNGNLVLGQPGPVPPEFPGLAVSNVAPVFDGSGDYVQINNAIPFGSAYSIELLFKADYNQLSGENVPFSAFTGGDHGIFLQITNHQLRFAHRAVLSDLGGESVLYDFPTDSGDPFYNTFHHVVAVKEEGTDGMKLFLDGRLVGTATPTGPTSFPDLDILLGRLLPSEGVRDFAGTLDEVAVYNQALTAADVQRHYDAANPPTLGNDASGLNPALDLTREGSPSYEAVDGSFGSVLAMSFNGSTDGYTRTSPVSTATDNFGIEAWIKPGSTASPQVIAYNGNGTFDGFGLLVYDGTLQGQYGGITKIDTGVAATPGVWRHVALVKDNGVTQIYVDGSLVYNTAISGPNLATTGFAIGRSPEVAATYLTGSVDDVRVFTFAPGTFDPQDLGINETLSGTWSWMYDTDDGPAEGQTVTITATTSVSGDVSGDETSIPFTLVVDNVAPSATLGNSGPVSENSSSTVSFSDQFDPSTADTTAGFRYAYDFDNDGVFEIGDGTYAGSSTNDSETVPASYLADGPGTRTVHGRILDKDGGYTDTTTMITINNVAPTVSISGPADGLVNQMVSFLLGGNDSPADQAAGFTYDIDWGDGSSDTVDPVAGTGDAIARHAYAATGSYTVQVTATDKDGATSAVPATTSIQINPADASNLETIVASAPFVELAVSDDAALQDAVAAINAMAAPTEPKAITLILGDGPYSGMTLSPPENIILNLAGNDTKDVDGTLISNASGPAVMVTSGEVFLQGDRLATSADAPAVLVTGGHLTLDQSEVEETGGFLNVAVKVSGGSANLGFDVVMKIHGVGAFVDTYARSALVPHPEGIDAELTPNTYQIDDGVVDGTINAVSLSSTSVSSSAATTPVGEAVTFTAIVDVKAVEHGLATGKVSFYDGETLLGEGVVNYVSGQFVAEFSTDALSVGGHTVTAVYSGDDAYVASLDELTHEVLAHINYLPVVVNDSYSTTAGTELSIAASGVLANDTDMDGDALTAVEVTDPAHGMLTLNGDGSFVYTPDAGYVGSDSFTYLANDGTANSNTASVSIGVNFAFTGFFSPVDNLPTINRAKAGSSIPIKFSLDGDQGLDILAAGYPTSVQVTCNNNVPTDNIEELTVSKSGLRYDAGSDQYIYVWKTPKKWSGTCRQFKLRLTDGTEYVALFRFR